MIDTSSANILFTALSYKDNFKDDYKMFWKNLSLVANAVSRLFPLVRNYGKKSGGSSSWLLGSIEGEQNFDKIHGRDSNGTG
jgi:hypothetical protein